MNWRVKAPDKCSQMNTSTLCNRLRADVSTSTTTDWSRRTLKFDSKFSDERTAKCLTSSDISRSLDFDVSKSDFEEATHDIEMTESILSETNSPRSPRRCTSAIEA